MFQFHRLAALSLLTLQGAWSAVAAQAQPTLTFSPAGPQQSAPHGQGNVYAPEVLRIDGQFYLWFGGQGADGHDRIQLATSDDGVAWVQQGIAFDDPNANHCNDPTIVTTPQGYFMYYTRAVAGVTDCIALATSPDAKRWTLHGPIFYPGAANEWDALSVGRPAALYVDGVFHLWYDGRRDLPLGAPDATAPQSATSQRAIGYATSSDGIRWGRCPSNPVLRDDYGGVDVFQTPAGYGMVVESRDGVYAATSRNGRDWKKMGLLVAKQPTDAERHGHVTPFVLTESGDGGATLFYGGAAAASWDRNAIYRLPLVDNLWNRFRD